MNEIVVSFNPCRDNHNPYRRDPLNPSVYVGEEGEIIEDDEVARRGAGGEGGARSLVSVGGRGFFPMQGD